MNKYISTLLFVIYALVTAVLYGVLSYFVFYIKIAQMDLFTTYILNIVSMVAFLILGAVIFPNGLTVTASSLAWPSLDVLYIIKLLPLKSGLYLYYLLLLVLSQLAKIDAFTLQHQEFIDYSISLEYSIVVLIAIDRIAAQIIKDRERIIDNESKHRVTKEAYNMIMPKKWRIEDE